MKSMTVLIRAAALFGVLLLVSVPALAQGKWWHSPEFQRELRLTAEQIRQLEDIFQKAMPRMKVLKSTFDQAEARFQELLMKGGDGNDIMEQVNVVEAARSEMNKGRVLMLVAMRNRLTMEQWARFTALQDQLAQKKDQGQKPGQKPQ